MNSYGDSRSRQSRANSFQKSSSQSVTVKHILKLPSRHLDIATGPFLRDLLNYAVLAFATLAAFFLQRSSLDLVISTILGDLHNSFVPLACRIVNRSLTLLNTDMIRHHYTKEVTDRLHHRMNFLAMQFSSISQLVHICEV